MGRPADALAAGDSVVHRFGADEAPGLRFGAALALFINGTALRALNRCAEALDAWDQFLRRRELLQRDGTSVAFDALDDVMRRFADTALLAKAQAAVQERRYDDAIVTAGRVLGMPGTATPEDRWRGHLIRAIAMRRKGNPSACVGDIAAMLGVLSEMDVLPSEMGRTLRWASRTVGQERLRELIAASPSADLLLPFTIALERERGIESRVAREVEEVAEDIRRDLATQGGERSTQ